MIYRICDTGAHEFIDFVTDEGFWLVHNLNGSPRREHWQPLPVQRVLDDDDGNAMSPGNFLWYTASKLIMRTSAVVALRDLLETGGELLPLATDDGVSLFILNVTRTLDALDESRSTIERYDSGEIMFIRAPAFHEHIVRDLPFFRLPFLGSPLYIGQTFRQRARQAGLTGIDFALAWSPQTGPVPMKLR